MTNTIIQLNQAKKVFETESIQTQALRGIDLTITAGEFVAISGPSGCGKSTLLSVLGLMDTLSEGQYILDGEDTSTISIDQAAKIRNAKLGFIFQSFNLIEELSVLENVMLPLRYSANLKKNSDIKQAAQTCLAAVGLEHRAEHKSSELSGGQQQRVAIARALVNQPQVLLVDEPTGNLDSHSGEQVMEVLNELHKKGTTICLVTHDQRYAQMAQRQFQMLDGAFLHTDGVVAK